MVTLERPAYYFAQRDNEYCGLSTDDKATFKAGNGDEFYEIDKSKEAICCDKRQIVCERAVIKWCVFIDGF